MRRLVSVLTVLILLIIVALGAYFVANRRSLSVSGDNLSQYTAVALTSNELFFGHIKQENATQLVLEDVYFFTYVPDAGTDASGKPAATPAADTNQNLRPTLIDTAAKDSLAPTSTYVINKDMIKYQYPLKKDSKVVTTIEDYKKSNK